MNNIISINKLAYRYNDEFIFHNFDLDIEKGSWVTIVGPNASGKSTLIKILTGLIETNDDIVIDGLNLNKNNLYNIRKNIGVVFENPDNSFICETVKEDMSLILHNLSYSKEQAEIMVMETAKLFNISHLLDSDPHSISGGEKQKVALACSLVHNPKILILDESLCMIDEKSKSEILDILNRLYKEKQITIINTTHDLSESFYSDRLIVINKGEILLDGQPKKVMLYDKVLNRVGIEIPFIVDLSIKLKLYGLLEDITFDMDEMVNLLWK